jgi:hypothetical protein
MSLLPTLALLVGLAGLAHGCRTSDSSGGVTPSVTLPMDAGVGGDADAGDGAAPVDVLEIFLEAARTDLARPFPESSATSRDLYAAAAARQLADALLPSDDSMEIITRVLATSNDPRARRALMQWVAAPATSNEHRTRVLDAMKGNPREEYLETVQAILDDDNLAGTIVLSRIDLFYEALQTNVKASLHAEALILAERLPGDRGRALLRRIAEDRSLSTPNPRTLTAFRCPDGRSPIQSEAQALANLRILALACLQDKALLRRVGTDPSEPALVRTWALRLLRGKPARLDARAERLRKNVDKPEGVPFVVEDIHAPCP